MADDILQWPEWLGSPLQDGYEVKPLDRRINTDMEVSGNFRVAFTTDETHVKCKLILGADGANFFESFVHNALHQGTDWFSLKLWIGGQMVNHNAQFFTLPTYTNSALYTTYTFTLRIDKRNQLMDADLILILLEISPDNIVLLSNKLHHITFTVMPKCTTVPFNIWTATEEQWEAAR